MYGIWMSRVIESYGMWDNENKKHWKTRWRRGKGRTKLYTRRVKILHDIRVRSYAKFYRYLGIGGCIQKFPDWVDKEINNNNILRSNTKGYGGKTAESCTICSSRFRWPVRTFWIHSHIQGILLHWCKVSQQTRLKIKVIWYACCAQRQESARSEDTWNIPDYTLHRVTAILMNTEQFFNEGRQAGMSCRLFSRKSYSCQHITNNHM